MSAVDTRTQAGDRAEGVIQVVILLTIGCVAAAASFTHVHNVAVAHGQPGWLAWADAIVLELMSIATGLEIRRRARSGRSRGFVSAVLVAAVALSLAAQVVEAEWSVIGWLAAALPALGFLACVKIVLGRTTARITDPSTPSVAVTTGLSSVDRPHETVTEPDTYVSTPVAASGPATRAARLPLPATAFTRDNSAHSGASR